jgi:hypothetical protein
LDTINEKTDEIYNTFPADHLELHCDFGHYKIIPKKTNNPETFPWPIAS